MSIHEHFTQRGIEPPQETADQPAFWRAFWKHSITPWDLGRPHAELVRRTAALRTMLATDRDSMRVIVPGCGRGHDAVYLATDGWSVKAIDFAEETAPLVRARLEAVGGTFCLADALAFRAEQPFDLWWEHTFFCAIPPERRPDWGRAAREAIRTDGLLAAIVFPCDKPAEDGGPPFGISTAAMDDALGTAFERLTDDPITTNDHERRYPERFAIWRRTAS